MYGIMSYETYPVEFHTEIFESIISIIALASSALLTLTYIILTWVCVTKSPPAMSRYKWFILINATTGIIYEYFFTLTQPQMLSPYPITVISGGLLATIALSDSYTNTLLFVYRYGQTVKGWMYERVLSNNKLTTFLFVSLWLILMCPLVVPVHLYAIPKTQLIEVVQKFDINLYERIKDANVVGGMREQVQVANRFTMSFAVIWGLTMFAVTLFCTYSCFRFLRQNNDRLSTRTRALYLTLINVLVVEMIIGIFVAGLPLCFVILAYLFKMPFGSYVFSVAIRMSSIYPLSANITLIWMVRPYRNAVKDVLKKFKCVNGIEPAPQLTALQDISTIGSWQ